jgi:ABC-type nitrate/sulfonate/bicarbonate transport system substrate-binding protein
VTDNPQELLAGLRREVASLLGLIDTSVKPRPFHIRAAHESNPGPVWRPAEKWTVRCIDPDEGSPISVFVTTPDSWDDDFRAHSPEEARRIAMALLAAADWADEQQAQVIHLDTRRDSGTGDPKVIRP